MKKLKTALIRLILGNDCLSLNCDLIFKRDKNDDQNTINLVVSLPASVGKDDVEVK